jgi:glycosyltransferase involved in cell wall biosynthesis
MASHHIHGQKLKRLSYYFPFDPNRYSQEDAKNHRAAFRKAHGIRDDEFLVVGMGLVSDRKGTDLFIEVCEQIVRKNVAIKFCWIGAFESNALEAIIREQVKEKGLEQHIIFTGPLKPHFYNLSPFDLFFLSSREDPYPLVVLEAALMKLPSVCFSPSGGIVEFVSTDAGWVINGFSATAAANEIIKLSNKPWVLKEFGIQAFKKVMQWHCNPELIMSEFTSIIDSLHLKHK